MGKGRGWITEWKRNKNLPSPEEAARMCAILNTTPEEILTEPDDIALVRELIEQERAKQGIKNAPTGDTDERNVEFIKLLEKLNDTEKDIILAQLRGIAQGR